MNENAEAGTEECIHKAYESLKKGEAAAALSFLKEALETDFEHEEVLYALKCLNWWLEKIKRLDDYNDPYEQGEYLLSQWKSYYGFLDLIGGTMLGGKETEIPCRECELPYRERYDSCQYALRRFVYSQALECFLSLMGDGANQRDPVLLLQTGRCCKRAGDWEEALKYLEQAGHFRREDSAILSELADIYALLGDERPAKVLFREAFFLDPQGVDLAGLESEMILALRDKVMDHGYIGQELAEWIPIWGCIWGIFSIKRELKPVELGRLKQSILSLENEYRSQGGGLKTDGRKPDGRMPERNPFLKPRLLNRYFWLIDHCEHYRDESGLMDETMLKIKFIDPVVHDHYRS